jgi:GTPase SAR1 family protein
VVLAVYDVTSVASFEEMKLWIEEVRNNSGSNVKIVIVGNKIDLIDQENKSAEFEPVSLNDAKNYANSLQSTLKLTSAYDNKGI